MVEARRGKQGETPLKGARILIVESGYYADIADTLRAGPGALEIPQAVVLALDAARGAYDGVVALGCVIRGETSHYDIVAGESARALMDIGVDRKIPVGNGILTVDTAAQAAVRAALDKGDKGGVAAGAALALIRIKRGLARPRKRR
jgi:6,7-dimethyl-8-ribityllumazine synthase